MNSTTNNTNLRNTLSATKDAQTYIEPLIFEKSSLGRTGVSLPTDHNDLILDLPNQLLRDQSTLTLPEVSEPDVVRHFTRLSTWNYAIDLNLYPLGSCTMKYNPRLNEEIAALPHFAHSHPSMPEAYVQPQLKVIYELQSYLTQLTDMKAATLQPAAGAHGELAGLFLIQAYHHKKNENRNIILIPDSAHGTNPATCTLAGYKVQELKSGPNGMIDIDALKSALNSDVAGLMITNPNTLGVFERSIAQAAELLHQNGSLLYMDGANFNAIIGKASLGKMGVDVCHLNLHKTFSTPHGGGGPGAAAVVVSDRLVPFLPAPLVQKTTNQLGQDVYSWFTPQHSIGRMKAGPGHFGVLIRALTYILTYGNEIHKIAEMATLNANIVRNELKDVLQLASNSDSMHEAVFSDASFKKTGFDTLTLAKALIDYGYHPPTVYFPLIVSGALMIEPTETESAETIRHFTDVVKDILNRMNNQDETLRQLPLRAPVTRVDEVAAARNPILNYFTNKNNQE